MLKDSLHSHRVLKYLVREAVMQGDIEWSVHSPPPSFRTELQLVFPSIKEFDELLIVPTCQKSGVELVYWGDDEAKQKDLLLGRFVDFASSVCEVLRAAGHWANYCDPCSGLPMLDTHANCVYPEVDALELLLGYRTMVSGGCKLVSHPRWGAAVYPATLFTQAPVALLLSAIESYVKPPHL